MPMFCNWLVLVPTAMERAYLEAVQSKLACVESCGFGPIISAARTASLIERLRPKRILLCGIAGRLSKDLQIGSAYLFRNVSCYGVGVGTGSDFRSTDEIGWSQWRDVELQIGAELPLDLAGCRHDSYSDLLVTACAASANQVDALNVKHKYPHANAEDMEGFSVAAAAAIAGLPTTIVRGISNDAGDRNHEAWRINEAMQAVNRIVLEILEAVQ